MTSEQSRITDELARAIEGDAWHGDALLAILEDIPATIASGRPPNGAHSIWEIVRHMTAWTGEVKRRVQGHPPGLPAEGDWPQPSGADDEDWRRDVNALVDAHRRLLSVIAGLSDEEVHAPAEEARNRPAGSGVSLYVLLHGLAQHHAYHGGQIALLKKMLGASR